jgi:tRNA pseudouridine38-40 synthase
VPAVIARLTLAYVGTHFAGWQRQPNAPTVQEALERALSRLTGEPVTTVAAGRTDAGVHARGQVVSLSLERDWSAGALVHGTNHHLPGEIRVLDAAAAPEGFHARRWALAKEYRYRLGRAHPPPPADAPFLARAPDCLDLDALVAATRRLPGRHDFAAFAVSGGAPGPTARRIFAAWWEESGTELDFRVVGEGFLRGMVRRLVGTLLEIGTGRRPPADLAALLVAPRGAEAGPTAPACGLSLERVDYGAGPRVSGSAADAAVD